MTYLHRLFDKGQSPWLDFISRAALQDGTIQTYLDQGIVGVTSNPAIFEQAIARSSTYDQAIRDLAAEGKSAFEIYDRLTIEDVAAAADLLRPIYDRTDGQDGHVSLEVSPELAHDTDGTIAEGLRLWKELSRPNVMIKVPATEAGIPAIRALIAAGVNVNVTLLFSRERYRASAEAYLAGLEDRMAAGGSVVRVESVASFFVSRLDSLVDPKLEPVDQGRAALALAQAAYGDWQEIFGGERFAALKAAGARTQRLLWASTGTKNPAYAKSLYVEGLVGPETVNTLPPATIAACLELEGEAVAVLPEAVPAALATIAELEGKGVDFAAAAAELEADGVKKFVEPF
ncbi:MAG: transaldolase, partial [Fimbriimonadaceae bacterium]|nr:transaldolase [Fimbriimonadaceae bacterium]